MILVTVCVCVCMCVFIKLHITAQSRPVILVILCHSLILPRGDQGYLLRKPLIRRDRGDSVCVCVCVCVCVYVFIKFHMTAQSGLVIRVILCHSH